MKSIIIKFSSYKAWLSFTLMLGVLHFISKFINYNPFLLERVLSFFILIAMFYFFNFRLILKRKNVAVIVFIFFMLMYWVFKADSLYLAPLAFIFFSFIVFLFNSESVIYIDKIKYNFKLFFSITVVFLGMYFFKSDLWIQQGNRFTGPLSSPTTFATWLTCIYICLCLPLSSDKLLGVQVEQIFAWLIVTFLIYKTGTRINLIYMLFPLVFMFFPVFLSKPKRKLLIFFCCFVVFFIYPAYGAISEYIGSDIIAYRFAGGADTSYGLRVSLFESVYYNFLNGGLITQLFGNGFESSRILIENTWGMDLYPHNDILRIIYDFGVVFSVFFIWLIAFLGSKNNLSMLLVILYVFSFLHNMVYSHYLIALIITSSRICQDFYRHENNG